MSDLWSHWLVHAVFFGKSSGTCTSGLHKPQFLRNSCKKPFHCILSVISKIKDCRHAYVNHSLPYLSNVANVYDKGKSRYFIWTQLARASLWESISWVNSKGLKMSSWECRNEEFLCLASEDSLWAQQKSWRTCFDLWTSTVTLDNEFHQ